MGNFNYFSDQEIVGLDVGLVAMLDKARHRSGIPYIITDGLRTPETNTDPNAVKNSAHIFGLAVDLRCHDSHTLWKMLDGLIFAGFNRIGIYFKTVDGKPQVTHLHADTSTVLPQGICWITEEL